MISCSCLLTKLALNWLMVGSKYSRRTGYKGQGSRLEVVKVVTMSPEQLQPKSMDCDHIRDHKQWPGLAMLRHCSYSDQCGSLRVEC